MESKSITGELVVGGMAEDRWGFMWHFVAVICLGSGSGRENYQ